ncbi:MAG TPA: class III extradiol ring-cleavage dioxygenase [Fontimonas sp.]
MRLPTYFIPHGGGPCFFMDWTYGPADTWHGMEAFLRGLMTGLPQRPNAILVVSAHWEAPLFTVNAAANPPLLYDYSGFPPHTYALQYPAPGAPALAQRVLALLAAGGTAANAIDHRGLDHGVFIPLMLIHPPADIPVLQLSLRAGLDPAEHLRVGELLAPLRDEGVLIIGSGMSFHNLQAMFSDGGADDARQFDDWLSQAVAAPAAQRSALLARWSQAPRARAAHPREEHLIPLMVAAGAAAADDGQRIYHEPILGNVVSGYRFG